MESTGLSFSPKRIDAHAAQKSFSVFSSDRCTHLIGEKVNQIDESRHRRPGHVVILCSFVQRIRIFTSILQVP